jgi:putative DNA primase/helicase
MEKTKDLAKGRWKEIILALTSISPEKLKNKHQPCPFCGGIDRYRFDDKQGSGSWFCNQGCAPDGRRSSNGFGFLMNYLNEDFKSVARRVDEYLGVCN